MILRVKPEQVVLDAKFQHLCKKPYYGHAHGCPNYGKKEGCPPRRMLDELFDFDKRLFIIYTAFPVGEFAQRMRRTHPEWTSPRQWYNPRRWQGIARAEHRLAIAESLWSDEMYIESSPEACGVNLTDTMKNIGITLDWTWPPDHSHYEKNLTYRISMAGHLLHPERKM